MSEREKKFIEMLSKLPEKAQDTFLAQAQGAVIAIDALKADEARRAAEAPSAGAET